MSFHTGRTPRKYGNIPHLSCLMSGRKIVAPPDSVNWTSQAKANPLFEMYGNDQYGDCPFAGLLNLRRLQDSIAKNFTTIDTTADALKMYGEVTGFMQNDPATDNGAALQDVLAFAKTTGTPIGKHGNSRDKITDYLEVDPRNHSDVMTVINDFGGIYMGFNVPKSLANALDNGNIPDTWDVRAGDSPSGEGHCVDGVNYGGKVLTIASWGREYEMTWAFWDAWVDECYLIINYTWLNSLNQTPLGMTVTQLESLLKGFASPPSEHSGISGSLTA